MNTLYNSGPNLISITYKILKGLKMFLILTAALYLYALITSFAYFLWGYYSKGDIAEIDGKFIGAMFEAAGIMLISIYLFIFQYLNFIYFVVLNRFFRYGLSKLIIAFLAGTVIIFLLSKGVYYLFDENIDLRIYKYFVFSIDFRKEEVQVSWFGILLPYLLFYSWFLPLWHYRLSGRRRMRAGNIGGTR